MVDDDPMLLQSLDGLLSSLGYRAELYGSAAEFIAAALKTEATCLICDIQLGGITGIELARHLISAGLRFPTIFITGSDYQRFWRDAEAVGCVAYLHKPFSPQRLMDAIRKAVRSR